MKKGKFIVIEGTDFSGKETQTNLLYDRLKNENIKIQKISFPQYEEPTGRIIGQCLLGKKRKEYIGDGNWFKDPDKVHPQIASLYYAADRKASAQKIKDKLSQGINIISDRYYQSNMGHQGGKIKNKAKREKMFDWIYKLEIEFLNIPKEDAVIFLHMPLKVALELKKTRKEQSDYIESNLKHLENAENSYLQLAEKYNWFKIECAPKKTIESLLTPQQIHEKIYEHIKKII